MTELSTPVGVMEPPPVDVPLPEPTVAPPDVSIGSNPPEAQTPPLDGADKIAEKVDDPGPEKTKEDSPIQEPSFKKVEYDRVSEHRLNEQVMQEYHREIVPTILTHYKIDIQSPDSWQKNPKVSPSLRKAIDKYAQIKRSDEAMAQDRLNRDEEKKKGEIPETELLTDKEIASKYMQGENDYFVFEGDEKVYDGKKAKTVSVNNTLGAFSKALDEISQDTTADPENKGKAEILSRYFKGTLARGINSPGEHFIVENELKQEYEMWHTGVDVLTGLLSDQLQSIGTLDNDKLMKVIKEKGIIRDPRVGRLANYIVWYHDSANNPDVRRNLSALIFQEMKGIKPTELAAISAKNPNFKDIQNRVNGWKPENSTDPAANETKTLFEGRLKMFDDQIIRIVRTRCGERGEEIARRFMINLPDKRDKMISIFMMADSLENTEFFHRDESGKIALKKEYASQFNEFMSDPKLGLANMQELIKDMALYPNVSAGVLSETIGVNPEQFQTEESFANQSKVAAELIANRLKSDETRVLPDSLAGIDIDIALNGPLQQALRRMIGHNMGPAFALDYNELRKKFGKGIKTGLMGLIMMWSGIMDVLNSDENLAPQGGGQRRH